MPYELFIALATFSFVSAVTPGPNNLLVMTSAANFGLRRTLPAWSGVCGGFTLMIVLVGIGLMRLFTAFPVSYLLLKSASVIYLLFLSWKIATAAPPDSVEKNKTKGTPLTFLQAALFQWVNPKAWAMALTAVSVYAPPSPALIDILLVAFVFGVVTVPSVGVWAMLGMQLGRLLATPLKLRIFNITTAVLLIASLYPILFGQL